MSRHREFDWREWHLVLENTATKEYYKSEVHIVEPDFSSDPFRKEADHVHHFILWRVYRGVAWLCRQKPALLHLQVPFWQTPNLRQIDRWNNVVVDGADSNLGIVRGNYLWRHIVLLGWMLCLQLNHRFLNDQLPDDGRGRGSLVDLSAPAWYWEIYRGVIKRYFYAPHQWRVFLRSHQKIDLLFCRKYPHAIQEQPVFFRWGFNCFKISALDDSWIKPQKTSRGRWGALMRLRTM